MKTLREIRIERRGAYWRFEFDASAFLHHMVRNIMGCLVAVGSGRAAADWLAQVLQSRDRSLAAPTFAPMACTSSGRTTMRRLQLPETTAAMDWLP